MKLSKILGVAAVAAMALMAFASTASATTLETNGVKKSESVTIESSLKSGTSALLTDTSKAFANTCTISRVHGDTASPFTATGTNPISGPITNLTFEGCTHKPVTVHKPGTLSVSWISGTTNGTVRSSGAEVTVPATLLGFVVTVNCKTENTDLGTLTGAASGGTSTMDINAVLNCGSSLPSAKWEATYVITGGHAIGVVE